MAEAAVYSIGDFVGFIEKPVTVAHVPKLWYLLRLHPNFDLKAERQLQERGISAYVPKEKQIVKGAWRRRIARTVPIFPGALFVADFHADIAMLKRNADGIGGFVKCAGEALRVSLATMAEIRRFEAKRDPERRKLKLNQRVRIVGGSFDMWEGRIDRLDPKYRIVVLIEMLMREVPLQLDEDQVEPV